MAESDTIENCDECQELLNRDFQAGIPHAASDRYDKPIISNSLAIGMDQIAEHKAQFPDIEVTNEGQLVFDKYSTHEAYLEKTGHIKHPGKRINNSGKTVTTMADIRKQLTTTV
jgi:hypothetical protein